MFDFVLHLHCIILFILQFSMFCIFFWCSKSFLSALFRLNPEQHDQHPSLVQMIPKLDSTSTCLECQDMPQVTEAKIHLLNHVFFVKNVEKNCCSNSPTCICWEHPIASWIFGPVLPPPPATLNWKPSSDKITGGTEAFPPTWLASAEEITSLGHVSRKLDIRTFFCQYMFVFPKLDFLDITLKKKWYDKWVVNYIKCGF